MNLCDLEHTPTCWDEIVDVGVQNWRKKVVKYFVVGWSSGLQCIISGVILRRGNTPFSEEQILQKIKWEERVCLMGKGNFRRSKGNEKNLL
jgi:hypothetical protein